MKYLKPQPLHEKYFEPIEAQLKDFIYEYLYKPLREVIQGTTKQKVIVNTKFEIIEKAISSGLIQYNNGIFSGRFNAALGRQLRSIGAIFNKQTKVFKMETSKVPDSIRIIAAQKQAHAREMSEKIELELNKIQEALPQVVDQTSVNYVKTIDRTTNDFKKLYKAIEVSPEESQDFKDKQNKEYSQRIKPYIKDWAEKEILQLRQDVSDNANKGYRFDHLIKTIQKRYGSSKSKAKFLARQETALFMSSYRKNRFVSAGIKQFKWSTSGDSRVRDDHKNLNGRIFDYANPPIIDTATGQHGLPGQGFGCRCVDIAILGGV
jgi:SPP1 gp7 family putative phage head morphogenesis protein